jgi:hypothetical protein
MATLSATRWNPVIGQHYRSLVERGRPKKVALDPATGDGALAAHLSGVAIDWRDTDKSGDTAAVELTEFR